MNKSQLFSNAWNIARKAAVEFGGSVKSYFAEALKMAYRAGKKISAEALEALGGKRWTKNAMDRVYFNGEVNAKMIGFSYSSYKTGNVSSASLRGESISNNRASSIRTSIFCCKCWFDLNDQAFHIDNYFKCDVPSQDILAAFRSAL